MLIPRELFFEVGGFDERYINGCEDIDLCLKVGQRHKRVIYNPKSVVTHFEGKSKGREDNMNFNRRLFLQIWRERIRQDDMHFLKQDGMELVVGPDGSFHFQPAAIRPGEGKAGIVIVTYNSAPTIRACIDSVLSYSGDSEVIIVDNASTDDTRAMLSHYKDRIVTIYNDENRGFSCACNQGIRASAGGVCHPSQPGYDCDTPVDKAPAGSLPIRGGCCWTGLELRSCITKI